MSAPPRSHCCARRADLFDFGMTPEGIHVPARVGTVDFVRRCVSGLMTAGDVPWFIPCIREELSRLDSCLRWCGHALDVGITGNPLTVRAQASNAAPIRFGPRQGVHEPGAGETRHFES